MAVPLELLLLGPLQMPCVDVAAGLGGPREQALLARLALDSGRVVSMERLIDDLYGDAPPVTARNTVQVYVSRLRHRLGASRVRSEGAGYGLLLDPDQVDVHRFCRLTAEGAALRRKESIQDAVRMLEEALDLWRGEPLSELTDYAFARTEIARLNEIRGTALEELAETLLAAGRAEDVVSQIAPALTRHPFRERLRMAVMTALYRSGQAAEAVAVYQHCRRLLDEELGLEPGPALKALYSAILTDDPTMVLAAPTAQPGLVAIAPPAPATPLIGRTAEVAGLCAVSLDPDVRLITLMGPGGAGKTRLALELAMHPPDAYIASTVWVSLVGLDDADQLPAAIGTALRLPAAEVGVQQVAEALHPGPALLLLDNAEHLLPELGRVLSGLLAACPQLTAIVTSRVALHLSGEHRFLLGPLPVPDPGALLSDVAGNPAVELFVARARQVEHAFELTDAVASAVAGICSRLDGLPLAIELAAARSGLLEPAAMLSRLESRLSLLTAGSVDAAERHRSLRATLDWSHRLLSEPAQSLLARLATFRGHFDLAAVEFVASPMGTSTPPDVSASEILQELLDASLVTRVTDGLGRFVLLETVFEYATERLRESGDEEPARDRHSQYFRAELLARTTNLPMRPVTEGALAWVPTEQENLRAATQWVQARDEQAFADLVIQAAWHWDDTGQWVTLEPWLLTVAQTCSGTQGFDAEYRLGLGTTDRGRLTDGMVHIERARNLLTTFDDPDRTALLTACRAVLARYGGAADDAMALAEETRQLADRASTPYIRAWVLTGAAVAMLNDDPSGGRELLLEARDAALLAGNARTVRLVALNLADVSIACGQPGEGLRWCREGLDKPGPHGERGYLLDLMGAAFLLEGRLAQVRPALQEALREALLLNDQVLLAEVVLYYSALLAARGEDTDAATLLGWHDAAFLALERTRIDSEVRVFDQFLSALPERLDASQYRHCLSRGQALSREQVVGWLLRDEIPDSGALPGRAEVTAQ